MRTDTASVKAILVTGLTDEEIMPIIGMANRIVTNKLGGESLTAAVLQDIETWITAHIIASTKERQFSEEKIDDISVKYQGTFGDFLKSSTYGQMALMLDTSGKLIEATKMKAKITATPQNSDWSAN